MNLSKRTIVLLIIGLLALVAAVMSARNDEDPELEQELEPELEPELGNEPAEMVIVPESEPAPDVETFKGGE